MVLLAPGASSGTHWGEYRASPEAVEFSFLCQLTATRNLEGLSPGIRESEGTRLAASHPRPHQDAFQKSAPRPAVMRAAAARTAIRVLHDRCWLRLARRIWFGLLFGHYRLLCLPLGRRNPGECVLCREGCIPLGLVLVAPAEETGKAASRALAQTIPESPSGPVQHTVLNRVGPGSATSGTGSWHPANRRNDSRPALASQGLTYIGLLYRIGTANK
jgi:hypothetical protein